MGGYSRAVLARIEAGLCIDCGKPPGPDGTPRFCRPCAKVRSALSSERQPIYRARRVAKGLCRCGKELTPGYRSCAACRADAQKRRAAEYDGLMARKAAAGICIACRQPRVGESRYCPKHYVTGIIRPFGAVLSDWQKWWALLEEQGFRCYYTGIDLVPGGNASIDHRVPRSRGGSASDIDNCAWVDWQINRAKGALTDVEYIERCRMVAERHPSLVRAVRMSRGA